MEQVNLALRIYHVGTEIAPCTCCENSIDSDSNLCRYVAFPKKNKNSNCYSKYACLRKSYDICLRNRIPLASE
jgi:hypothetical protein